VTRGELLLVDAIDLLLSILHPSRPLANLDGVGRPWWWRPSQAALVRMVQAAGFELRRPPQRLMIPAGAGHPRPGLREFWTLRHRAAREVAFTARFGDPHCALLATPAAG
jgi:hypothetical protein